MTDEQKKNVEDSEFVIRLISFPGCIKNDVLSIEAFSLYHKDEDYVSVIRQNYTDMTMIDSLGQRIKKWPEVGDKYYGYCSLLTKEIREESERFVVSSKYSETFPSHAGISILTSQGTVYMNTSGFCAPPDLLMLQMKLRNLAMKRPLHKLQQES